jgi:hypothetical protein
MRRTESYWSEHTVQPWICKVFPQTRFLWLNAKWSIIDPAIAAATTSTHWLYKLQPLIDTVRAACHQYWHCGQYITVDEQRVAFKGRAAGITYNPKKPTKWGFTVHMAACAASNWVHDFMVYGGKTTDSAETGLACNIVIKLVWRLLQRGHVVVADNWFSSLQLVRELYAAGTGYVGTLKASMAAGFPAAFRPRKPGEPKPLKLMGGKHRSYQAEHITVTEWSDRSTVKLVSSVDNPTTAATVKRWSAEKRARVQQPAPSVAHTYNRYAHGVDTANHYCEAYKTGSKSKRWWVVLAWAIINIAVHNAFLIHRAAADKPLSNRQFRLQLAQELVGDFTYRKRVQPSRSSVAGAGPPLHELDLSDKQRLCAECKKKHPMSWCKTCRVHVCWQKCYDLHRQRA